MNQEYEHFIRAQIGQIRMIARRYCRTRDMEDLEQEILLQLWRSFESFNNHSNRTTWMYRVALNTSISWLRKANRQKQALNLEALPEPISEPSAEMCQLSLLEKFLHSLSDTDANILMMYMDNLSNSAIADVIGIREVSVRKRISRIKNKFEQEYTGE